LVHPIERRLVVSENPVQAHGRNLLDRLGLTSRAQVAAWVVARAQGEQQAPP
jgi:DNA-binding NarL/FixJ family response regulator